MAINVRTAVPLSQYTTFQTGGPAAQFVTVTNEIELQEAVAYARAHALPLTIIGGGSNLLVADAGVTGLVVHIALKGVEILIEGDSVFMTVAAGEVFDEVIAETVARGYWGLENLSHIPGTVGATPVQNVGAYGVEVGERIALVRVFDTKHETFSTLGVVDCQFGYRDSIFKQPAGAHLVITTVTFVLQTTPQPCLSYHDLAASFGTASPSLASIRETVINIRSHKFPNWQTVGTAGSFFKNPLLSVTEYEALALRYPGLPAYPAKAGYVKVPLGWIFEHILKVKGQGNDRVGCYEGQALVVINRGGATTTDILSFTDQLALGVFEKTGIKVEREVRYLGA